jgi:PAS domain S-box-containing protein
MVILELVHNLAFLIALSVVSGFIDQRWHRKSLQGSIFQGVLFGTVAILGMMLPFVLSDGLIFDGRSVVISLCGLFFGPLSVAIAVLMAIAYRFAEGGAGTIMGISVITSSALIGLLFYNNRQKNGRNISFVYLILLGLVVHSVMLLLAFTLPYDTAITILRSTGVPILISYPLATVLIGKILSDQEQNMISVAKLKESESRWQFALEGAGDGVWDWNVKSNEVLYSSRWKRMLGYKPDEIDDSFDSWERLIHPEDKQQALSDLNNYLTRKSRLYRNEHRIKCKDGSYKWILDRGKIIEWGADGKPIRMIGTRSDIDERKQNEKIIRERDKQLQAIADNITGPAARVDRDLRYTFVSRWYERTYDMSTAQIIGRTMTDVISKENFSRIHPYIEQALNGNAVTVEIEFTMPAGVKIYEMSYIPDFDVENDIAGLFIIGNDITERKKAEKALSESELRYRNIFQSNHAVMLLIDMATDRIVDANPSAERFYGWTNEQLRQMKISDINMLSDEEVITETEKARNFQKNYFEFQHRLASGEVKDVEVYSGVVQIDGNDYLYSIVHDVTDRKKAEQEINASRYLMQYIIQHNPNAIAVFDNAMNYVYVSKRFLDDYQITERDIIGKNHYDVVPDIPPKWREVHRRALQGEVLHMEDDYFKRADGSVMFTQWECRPWHNGDGSIGGIVLYTEVITERKKMEFSIRESEERYRIVADFTFNWEHWVGPDGQYRYISPSVERITGYRPEEFIKKPDLFLECIHPDDRKLMVDHLRNDLHKDMHDASDIEFRVRTKDGKIKWVNHICRPVKLTDGSYAGRRASHIDITKRKMAEIALRESERQLATLIGNLPGMVYRCKNNSDWAMEFVSDGCHLVTGYIPSDLLESKLISYADVIHPADRQRVWDEVQKALADNVHFQVMYRIHNADGEERWVWEQGSGVYSEDGDVVAVEGVITDVTEKRRAEERVIESEALNAAIISCSPVALYSIDTNGHVMTWNSSAERIFGWSADELIGKPLPIIPDDKQEEYASFRKRSMEGNGITGIHIVRKKKDGSLFDASLSTAPLYNARGKMIGILGALEDITHRQKNEIALKESEERYRLLFENTNDAIFLTKPDGTIISANPEACRMFGHTEEEFREIHRAGVVDRTDPRLVPALEERKKTGKYKGELKFVKKDGTIFNGEIYSSLYTDAAGVERSTMIIRDVTERNRDRLALENRNRYIQSILDNLPIGVAVNAIHDGAVEYINDKFSEIYGWPKEDLTEVSRFFELVYPDPDYRHDIQMRIMQDIESGDPSRMSWDNIEITTKKREKRVISAVNIPILDQNVMVSTVQDITARVHAEREIQKLNSELEQRVVERTAQLEAANKELEAFAYSVSHDLRAPLRSIDGFSRFLIEDYADKLDSEGHRLLTVIRSNTQRMDQLITHLLSLSRVTRIVMNQVLIDMSKLAYSIYHEITDDRIREKFTLSVGSLPDTRGDATLISQVWHNLISNAIKYSMKSDTKKIEIGGTNERNKNVYFIRDHGAGFNSRYSHKLFKVFQRLHTANEFEGTGIGLAVVQRIIHRHGGEVWADGEVGRGAIFYFSLPVLSIEKE